MSDPLAALVHRWNVGDQDALTQLIDLLHDDLRRMAHAYMQIERDGHTLSTTGLVHEAYVQLAERTGAVAWRGRAELMALVSKVMRHVLVDYARRRRAGKRGGGYLRVALTDDIAVADTEVAEVLAVDHAIEKLAVRDARLAQVVECRFFGGMSENEIADLLGVSTRTVERDWTRARAYLFTVLK